MTIYILSATATSDSKLILRTGADEKMRIMHDGKVGIGTIAPSAKLHVNGDIRWAPVTSFVSVGPWSFHPQEPLSETYTVNALGALPGLDPIESGALIQLAFYGANVNLPNGATITSFTVFLR